MHLPKQSNPHLIVNATRIVSRKFLQFQDDSGGDIGQSGVMDGTRPDSQEMEGLHATLDKMVSKRLKLKRTLRPSDEPHSSKRHKTSAEEESKSVEPQQHSKPVGGVIPSYSPRINH